MRADLDGLEAILTFVLCVIAALIIMGVTVLGIGLPKEGSAAEPSGVVSVRVPHEVTVSEETAPSGLPMCYDAYRVRDGQSGSEWLVLVMSEGPNGNEYVTLPIGDAR